MRRIHKGCALKKCRRQKQPEMLDPLSRKSQFSSKSSVTATLVHITHNSSAIFYFSLLWKLQQSPQPQVSVTLFERQRTAHWLRLNIICLFKTRTNSFVVLSLFVTGLNKSMFFWVVKVTDLRPRRSWLLAAEAHYVSEAFWIKSWHLRTCSLFNYSQPFRRRAGWLVGAAEAASAQLLSLTGRHLIHSPDTQPAPR